MRVEDNLSALRAFADLNGLDVFTYTDWGAPRTCAVLDPEDPAVFAYIEGDQLLYLGEDYEFHAVDPAALAALKM